MTIPPRDTAFLTDRGFDWDTLPDPAGGAFLVVKDLDVSGGGFSPVKTDLMIRIPAQYPMAPLDCWYCDPPIRIANTGQFARASEVQEPYLNRNWQRFSRHLNGNWRPGVDSIRSYFTHILRELQGRA